MTLLSSRSLTLTESVGLRAGAFVPAPWPLNAHPNRSDIATLNRRTREVMPDALE